MKGTVFSALALACFVLACRASLPEPPAVAGREQRGAHLAAAAGPGAPPAATAPGAPARAADPAAAALDAELAQFGRWVVPVDASSLSARDSAAVRRLISAGELIERIFWQQSYREGWDIRTRLSASSDPQDRKRLELLLFNAGPFDRLRHFQPFYGSSPRPKGGGFYPEDLTASELDAYLAAHPEQREALLSPTTVVHRQGARLVAVPFHQEYAAWLVPAAAELRAAAAEVEDPGMARLLTACGEALAGGSFAACDRAWREAAGNRLVVFVGLQSTPRDELGKVKQVYALSVGLEDAGGQALATACLTHLDELERHLPLAPAHRRTGIRPETAMAVTDDLFRAGGLGHGSLGSMMLPPDPQARVGGGCNVLSKNVIAIRGKAQVLPVARALLVPAAQRAVTSGAYFDFTLTHFVGHFLGPHTISSGGRQVAVQERLGNSFGAIEETKAELAALDALDWAVAQGLLPPSAAREHYGSFVPHVLLVLSEGSRGIAPPIHDRSARLIVNWCRDKGALARDAASGRWSVDGERLPAALHQLLAEILDIQATGEQARAVELLDRYGKIDADLQDAVERVAAVRPLSFDPEFRVHWR
jgi:hypothetical protein